MIARRLILSVLIAVLSALAFSSSPVLAAKRYVPSGSFGTEGSGNGQFKEPTALAVNDSLVEPTAGYVYVLDKGNDRIQWFKFSSTTKLYEYAGQFDGSATPAKSFSSPEGIAIDNSGKTALEDPYVGDVYVTDTGNKVIDKFTATGAYIGQLKETTPGVSFGVLHSVTVDPSGDVWVEESEESISISGIDEFSDTGVFVKSFNTRQFAGPEFHGLAIDAAGSLYVDTCCEGRIRKFDSATGAEIETNHNGIDERVSDLAINPATNDLLADKGNTILRYGPFGEPYSAALETFASEGLAGSQGISVSATGTAYASQAGTDNVEFYEYLLFPAVSTEGSSEVSESTGTLHGSVNPEGEPIVDCHFEYGTEASYGQSVPCEKAPTGATPVPESVKLAGLAPRTTYHFRLVAANAHGATYGGDETFYTLDNPVVERESSFNVGSSIATVSAWINPAGAPTTYSVDYGTGEHSSSAPDVSIGSGFQAAAVQVQLSGLQPGAKYHFRFVARNALGVAEGADMTFTTAQSVSVSSLLLPDSRAYELVSSASGNQNAYDPDTGANSADPEDTSAVLPYRAASDGDSVVYTGEPPAEGGNGAFGGGQGNQFLAQRAPVGWTTEDITPPGTDANTEYEYFSSDLSVGIVKSLAPITSAHPPGQAGCWNLYSRTTSDLSYRSLFSAAQPPGQCGFATSAGASADGSHMLFYTKGALTAEAKAGTGKGQNNLYDSSGGQVHLVNVLPDGQPQPIPGASFGGPQLTPGTPDLSNAVSADGSRIFWTSVENVGAPEEPAFRPKVLYVRKNDAQPQSPIGPQGECSVSGDACTIQVDSGEPACVSEGKCAGGGGTFWTATGDGARVFFTDCNRLTSDSTAVASGECIRQEEGPGVEFAGEDLYEYDLDTGRVDDLTVDHDQGDLGGADVQGVVGTSDDGSYVYYVAEGVLTAGENVEGEAPVKGQPNLYERHDGSTTFIARLSNEDNKFPALFSGGWGYRGDWRGPLGERTAQVTSDGHGLVLTSTRSLTGYDSLGLREIFVYDAISKRLTCASCNPSGAPPAENSNSYSSVSGAYLPVSSQSTFTERLISDHGSRVFFETNQSLLPQDTNGLQDLYEWEHGGVGSCAAASAGEPEPGCVYLLSKGDSADNSYFVDSDANGENVFFTSRDRLVPQAHNETVAVYDARVGGGFQELSLACTGTGCQGVPPAPPIFATPSSVTFTGVGNFPKPVQAVVKPKSKVKQCKRGFVKKHGKCTRKKTKRPKKSGRHSENGRKR